MALKDILSHLHYPDACRLLGADGEKLLRQGGKWEIDLEHQVQMNSDRFTLKLGEAMVVVRDDPNSPKRLGYSCSACHGPCEHAGAAFSLILEEKILLGLAAPPTEDTPIENLTEEELEERALQEREQRAEKEKMILRSSDPEALWTDYTLTSRTSGKTYRVALRGWEKGESYCSCPDFKTNTLGTCKHILYAVQVVKRKFNREKKEIPYQRKNISLHIRYGKELELRLLLPEKLGVEVEAAAGPLRNRTIIDVRDLLERVRQIEGLGHPVHIYPDAEEHINHLLTREKLETITADIRRDPAHHPLRKGLLKVELIPYQLDGIAFAVGAGRAILADDMGLGKTIQGIGVSEFLAREAGISKVLVICPASVKSQWIQEIRRASGRDCQLVLGKADERAAQYDSGAFFTVCNYEQVLRDLLTIELVRWDLIILDEGQRIKNWEAKTTRTVKSLRSPYALVLSGTPLENRLHELYSIVQFIDAWRLGPAFRFFHRHRVVDEKGKLLGYRNLDDLRSRLKGILLRRTRAMVLKQLPPRSTETLRIPPTQEQADLHNSNKQIISTILSKKYISEMDLLRLQKALLICRMTADSTFLVDKTPPGFSSKLEELKSLLNELLQEEDRKIVLFSEWTTMLDLIEPVVKELGVDFVRLQGSVPQKKRQILINTFQSDPFCKLFMTTNAGATGLNLQAADTVVNVDLPWNPAVLEQRISRAHRMGQKKPVQVYLLVTEETIEESLLDTLSAKRKLALAALDSASNVKELAFGSSMEELKRRLEVLIGEKPPAPLDESQRLEEERQSGLLNRKQAVARAGGALFSAAFSFIGELIGESGGNGYGERKGEGSRPDEREQKLLQLLTEGLEKKEDGTLEMTVHFKDDSTLKTLAKTLRAIEIAAGGI